MKTCSKEGFMCAKKLDSTEEAKMKTISWILQTIDALNQLIDDRDTEIERLSSGKGKKANKYIIEEYIIYLLNNNLLEVAAVDELKEDIEYYIKAYEDVKCIQFYDEELFCKVICYKLLQQLLEELQDTNLYFTNFIDIYSI